MTSHQQPQPEELSTAERLKTTMGAVAQGIRYTLKGEHQTEGKAALQVDLADVEQIIASWPAAQQNVARQMLEKYGPPNEATPTRLFWHRNHPWKRTELTSDAVVHHWPAPHTDFLTQYLDYRVPPELTHLITMFDGSILVDRTRGEVAARCDSEAANVLGLNMVHELVTGKRTVEEARHISEQSTVAYNAGRQAPYAERLLFAVPEGGTEDLDQSHLAGSLLQQAVGKLKHAVTPGVGRRPPTAAPQLTAGTRHSRSLDGRAFMSEHAQVVARPGCDCRRRRRGRRPARRRGRAVTTLGGAARLWGYSRFRLKHSPVGGR